ncbi:glycosyltransferase [Pseudozyma hubeiensis SY62]|uniref:Glycosyltransferase n=1 Tax=Pseudozyma hubeiensis (strain SY62) TaxID=1305764 RepID=R9P7C6_PSEHS|nr:glycosyltransferase [Pseudozyma hubeiensis SY62]GAC97157.1 glycosyltransferase [Pseudozyma hubeiensis SY62]
MISSSQHSNTTRNAFVTLLTSDHYLPGALVLAESLRLSHGISNKGKHRAGAPPSSAADFQMVALITPETLSVQSIKAMRRSGLFDWIVGVEPIGFRQMLASSSPTSASTLTATDNAHPSFPAMIDSDLNAKIVEMERNLNLLGRPDLTNTLTKLHAWRLGRDSAHLVAHGATANGSAPQRWQGFDKVVFLDADTLVLRPIDHLFRLGTNVNFAAAPDTGWPDAFNSGVMMVVPSSRTFEAIRSFARTTGSWDGADQGLLNDFYGPEDGSDQFSANSQGAASSPGGGWKRLSFRYNVTSHGGYTFAPAYQRYGQTINIVHFIGQHKPWNRPRPAGTPEPNPLVGPRDLDSQRITPDQPDYLLALWHTAFASLYPSSGSASPDSEIEIVHTERGVEVVERRKFTVPTFQAVWDAEARDDTSITQAARTSSTLASTRPPVMEAAYASLPLDGRTSLIAPAPEVERSRSPQTPTQQSIDAEAMAKKDSATTSAPVAIPVRAQDDKEDDDDDSPQHFSPPKLSWNPAQEPPPSGSDASLYQMRVPIEAFYSNVWDAGQRTPRTLAEQKAAFFVPQVAASQQAGARGHGGPGYIPAQLRRDRVFDNLGSAKPDPSKVKPIFPWEAKHSATTAPTRVFPDEPRRPSPPPPSADKVPVRESTRDDSVLASALPQSTAPAQRSRGLPANLAYVNAWDEAGAIGNFANAWNRRNQPRSSPEKRRSRMGEAGHNTGFTSSPSSHPRSRDGQRNEGGKASSPDLRGATSSMRPAPAEAMERRSSLQEGDGTRDGEASDSRDGDDESSEGEESSANEEPSQVVADRGATPSPTNARQAGWPREGPGRGYMRKAENSMHAQMNATPRSPRLGSRVLSYTSTATEGEGRSGGGRFSSSSSASASTITTSDVAAAARQRAKDRIRPDGWVSTGSAGSGMSSPPPGYHSASTLRGIPGANSVGTSRTGYAPSHYQGMTGRRRETNSSNESQSGESGANSPTALLSPSLVSASGSMPFLTNNSARSFGNAMAARTRLPAPSELDEPFSSSPVNLRTELSRQARTHQQAKYASASRGHRPS